MLYVFLFFTITLSCISTASLVSTFKMPESSSIDKEMAARFSHIDKELLIIKTILLMNASSRKENEAQ